LGKRQHWGLCLSTKDAHVGLNLGAIAVATGIAAIVLGTFKPHWFWVLLPVVCLAFWFIAALMISEPTRREHLAGTLKHSRYTQIYTYLTKSGVDRIWDSVCDPVDEKASWPTLFRAALTWRLYDKALLFAVAYPIMLLVGQWVATGSEARLGNFPVLAEAEFWPARAAILAAILILTTGKIAQTLASASLRPGLRNAADWLILVAFALALAGVLADAVPLTGTFAVVLAGVGAVNGVGALVLTGAIAGAVALAVGFAGALAAVVTVALALAGAFALAGAIDLMDERGKGRPARWLVTVGVIVVLVAAALVLDWAAVSDGNRSLFLFMSALPLFNALFDVVSYAVTLSLIRRGLSSRWPFLWGLMDLVIAGVLFLSLGFVLVVLVHGLNVLAGVPFLDLQALFAGIYNTPEKYVWLYLMLFSTILPTALHGAVSLIGLQGIWPKSWRKWLAGLVSDAPESLPKSVLASGVLGAVWAIPVMGVVLLGWLALWLGEPVVHYVLELYFQVLLWGAAIPIGAI